MVNTRSRAGITFERHIARLQRKHGHAVRIAASGAGGEGSPDIIVGIDGQTWSLECKNTTAEEVIIPLVQHDAFKRYAKSFGSIAMYLVKFTNRGHHVFFDNMHYVIRKKTMSLRLGAGILVDIKRPISVWIPQAMSQWFGED